MATAAQIAEIRLESGDDISGKYVVSDEIISNWYDASGSICGTAYRVARARLAAVGKSLGAAGESQASNPKVQAVEALMRALRADCPDATPVISAGYLNLGIDEETSLVDIE